MPPPKSKTIQDTESKTRLYALVFSLSLDLKTLNLKSGLILLLLIWGGGRKFFFAILLFAYDEIKYCILELEEKFVGGEWWWVVVVVVVVICEFSVWSKPLS